MNVFLIVLFVIACGASSVTSQWDFAVTTKSRIIFYDENWSIITTAAHQFDELSAITFDESEERIYFNDKSHNNGSIFSVKLSLDADGNHLTKQHLTRTQNESIAGISFDPLDRFLYWSDAKNRKIYRLATSEGENSAPEVLFDFSKEGAIPDGIAVDICRRKLYWTNSNHKNPSIERSSLDGKNREVLVDTNLFLPHGIAVDQFSKRIYWVVDQQGIHFSVESSNLDGTDRQVVVKGLNNVPFNLAVTKRSIYWTDLTHNAVWNISKTSFPIERPSKVQNFPAQPKGIVARTHFLSKLTNNNECKDVLRDIKSELLEPKNFEKTTHDEINEKVPKRDIFCLNQGEYNPHSGLCICKVGFTGARCEVDGCHNYCVHGTCNLSSMGFAECTCQEGFNGERCETYKCHGFCLNEGRCEILNDSPICHCPDTHAGVRCESNTTESCLPYCRIRIYDTTSPVPYSCYDTCENYAENTKDVKHNYSKESLTTCSSTYNKTVIFVVIGVLTGLTLVFLIVQSIKRIYKPARPRIKKTFVVQKKMSQTPLTSRPVATEQCEITIENCCNMNICDTPCFDPKLLQQNMSYDSCTKEDKKILINNMEEDLY